MKIILTLLFVCLASVASAQTIAVHGSESFTIPPGNHLIVPAGQIVDLPASAAYDAILVDGTLRVQRTVDTSVHFTELVIREGGYLDVGNALDPMPCGRSVALVINGVPIDLSLDPLQWGRGLLNVSGRITAQSACPRTSWSPLTSAVPAGVTQITVEDATNWQVGDDLEITDPKQPAANNSAMSQFRREVGLKVASVAGNIVGLNQPIQFARDPILDPGNGSLVLHARVLNLSRDIVILSGDPDGVRGHVAMTGTATWDLQDVEFRRLGRTEPRTLDASNQIGRYAFHDHMVHDASASVFTNNSLRGHPNSKWGVAIHHSNSTRVEGNVCVGFRGACFVSEDRPATHSDFAGNLAAFVDGISGQANCPGCEGYGFWFNGTENYIDGVEGWNNKQAGISLNNSNATPEALALSFDGNVSAGNANDGIENWEMNNRPGNGVPWTNIIVANNRRHGFRGERADAFYIQNLTCISQIAWNGSACLSSPQAYVRNFVIEGGRIAGFYEGVSTGGSFGLFRMSQVSLQNRTNLPLGAQVQEILLDRLTHEPFGANPPRYITWARNYAWDGTSSIPAYLNSHWESQSFGCTARIVDWQGTGQDYCLTRIQQLPDQIAWTARDANSSTYVPEAGLTAKQAYEKYGLGFEGAVLDQVVELDGLMDAYAGIAMPLGPARGVLTYPNLLAPANLRADGRIALRLQLTGSLEGATRQMLVTVDSDAPVVVTPPNDGEWLNFLTTRNAPGFHTAQIQRISTSGGAIGQAMTFRYFVGDAMPPPDPDPDPDPEPDPDPVWTTRLGVFQELIDHLGAILDRRFCPADGGACFPVIVP